MGSSHGIRGTAEALVSGRASGVNDHFFCRVYGPAGAARPTSIAFALDDERPASPSGQFTRYRMGAMTLSRPRSAVLYIKCSSEQFTTSGGKPWGIRGELYNRGLPAGGDENIREENLNVLHAVSLALARQLGRADDAGLPAAFTVPERAPGKGAPPEGAGK
ncbi:hypothetical protein [Streptomyces sp. NPDC002690]